MTTYNPNTTIYNGGYHTSSGTVSITGAGAAGTVLTTGGSNGSITTSAHWASPSAHFNNSAGTPLMTIPHGEDKIIVEEKAALEVKGSVVINGLDLEERLKTIEKVLAIPERDLTLESKHPKLKELYDEYIRTLAKYRTWEALSNE